MKSLGLVEVSGVTAAVDCLDIMCKSADVRFVTWERKLGGRLVTVVVSGDVSAVKSAVESAEANAIIKPVAKAVIASPHEETLRLMKLSASRLDKKKQAEKKAPAKTAEKAKDNLDKDTQKTKK